MLFFKKALLRVFDWVLVLAILLRWQDRRSRYTIQQTLKMILLVAKRAYYHYRKGQKSICLALERRLPDLKEGRINPDELVTVLRSEAALLVAPPPPWLRVYYEGKKDVLLSIWALLEAGCLGPLDLYPFSGEVRRNLIRRAKNYAHSRAEDYTRLEFFPFFAIPKVPS